MEFLYGKNPTKYVHLWGSSPQGNIFLVKKRRSILHYYKNPKPLENKVHIIYLSSGTLKLWKFFNLTFGRSLVGTTPILSIGFFFFFFVVQILSMAREDRAAYWRFSASSVGTVCGKEHSRSHTTTSWTKSCMVLTRLMANNNNNNRDEPRTTTLER